MEQPVVTNPDITFKDKNEQMTVAQQLSELKNHAGWKQLQVYLTEKIKYFDYLLQNGEIKTLGELSLIRYRRNLTEQFVNLPEILTAFIEANNKEIKFDPYETALSPKDAKNIFDPYETVDTQST